MTFKKRTLKRNYTKSPIKRKYIKKKKTSGSFLKILLYIIIFLFIISWISALVLYQKYIVGLPSVKELQNLNIAESSTIYDRNWVELYKIFKENRTYVSFDDINKNMVNAIVSWEDKTFFTNPWVDLKWIIRAVFNYTIWKTTKIKWTSTISQQLIRNTIIRNERKLERKIKEIYLSYKMTKTLSKQKILELYLNKISFWSNAYGIEQASQTFFAKKASQLWVLESSILASLPKWPTYYSPYNHPDRVVWYPYVYPKNEIKNIYKIITTKDFILYKKSVTLLKDFIWWLQAKRLSDSKTLICWLDEIKLKNNIRVDQDSCSIMDYSELSHLLNSIKISNKDSIIEYQTWRKDFILWRMLEDKYINFDDYKKAILEWINYNFKRSKENIKAAHFVFYVREYLENKYWKDVVEAGGLKIYTTLDFNLQAKAEEIIGKQTKINETKFWASNAALISIDNKNGDILSMVWWNNYFDIENKWNVNIITSKLQPGSTFKPFVYSMWIYNKKIWTDTPIYDLETKFSEDYTPSNFDSKFMGKIDIATALNNSRNIPAIKMLYMAWWEKKIVKFMRKLWVKSLNLKWRYWAPLALWTWEMTPLELVQAYSVFANLWEKVELSPILKIIDSKWNIIEEKKNIKKEKVMSAGQAYIMNSILTDTTKRPDFWNNYLTINWRKLAAKTWTSTKQKMKDWKKDIYPANLWTVWYTPQITTVVWAWNTTWKKLNYKWNGLEWAGPIMRDFMAFAHKWKKVEEWIKPNDVKEIEISTISWLLPSQELMNTSFVKKWLFLNSPDEYDNSLKSIKVDILCNWIVNSNTPKAAIKTVNLIQLHSLMPNNSDWEDPVKQWSKSNEMKKIYGNYKNIITYTTDKPCERKITKWTIKIASTTKKWDTFVHWNNYIELAYRWTNPIIKLEIFIWDRLIDEINLQNKKQWTYRWNINIPSDIYWIQSLKIRVIDSWYYSSYETKEINVVKKDNNPPKIEISNPSDLSIKLYSDEFFNLRGKVTDRKDIRVINIYIDNKPLNIGITRRNFIQRINWKWLSPWIHSITVNAIDSDFNTWKIKIKLEIIKK